MVDFFRELTLTKERIAAWVFRMVLAFAVSAGTAVLYMAWGSLTEVKADLRSGIQQQWLAIGKINDGQAQASRDLGIQTQTLSDHIKTETDIDAQLRDITKDHEQRLRLIERPSHGG